MVELFNTTTFRKAVHVGNTTYDTSVTEDVFLKNDIMGSVKGNIENILDSRNPSYRVLFYSGQLDVIVAYPFTENFLRNLDFGGKETYLTASREFVYYKNELKGYVKKAKNLYE
ncbi:venom serine carboxypeptidase-like, partial [Diaphorina citri]|uniref:Venom serine carboxypeptidase-like n=1 Tax=Diaphorina citri TaxID=121845 RepID=A0A3Q0JKS9_DIACI